MNNYDTVVIGGGAAGLSAALRAHELGLSVLILDENEKLGGSLSACIGAGAGVKLEANCRGADIIGALVRSVEKSGVEYVLNAHAIEIRNYSDMEKVVIYTSPDGVKEIRAGSVIYAAGAREIHQFEAGITGDRVAGIYTVGEAQSYMRKYGMLPGRRVVVTGADDAGLAMGMALAKEGVEVTLVGEVFDGEYANEIREKLGALGVNLYLTHNVTEIRGKGRVERAKVVDVHDVGASEQGRWIECDAVILSAGLVPKVKPLKKIGVMIAPSTGGPVVNEYLESTVPGVFVAGNSLMQCGRIEYVVEQGKIAAGGAAKFVQGGMESIMWARVIPGNGVLFAVPHRISGFRDVVITAKVQKNARDTRLKIPELGIEKPVQVERSGIVRVKIEKNKLRDVRAISIETV